MELLLTNLAHGFGVALSFQNLTFALLGALIGTAIGVLPGIEEVGHQHQQWPGPGVEAAAIDHEAEEQHWHQGELGKVHQVHA